MAVVHSCTQVIQLTAPLAEKPLYEAIIDAQKLAFAPLSFQAALALRDLGILAALANNRSEGLTAERVAQLTRLPIYGVKILLESGVVCDLIRLDGDLFHIRQLGMLVLRDTMKIGRGS